jgi:hypothetical protein
MLERSYRVRRDIVPGRWVVLSRHGGRRWEVVVEPDVERELLVVITAYPVESDEPGWLATEESERIQTVLAEHIYELLKPGPAEDVVSNAAYLDGLKKLTAAGWRGAG